MYNDPTGRYIDLDLYPNQQAAKEFSEWYTGTDENEEDGDGNLTLDAKLKRTYQAINYNIEFELGLGVGIGQIQEVLDTGLGYTCYYDILSIQYCDGSWDVGQRLVMSLYASALLPIEVGPGLDGTFNNIGTAHGDYWLLFNPSQDSITIASYANYAFFIGGNVTLGFDIISFSKTMGAIWR